MPSWRLRNLLNVRLLAGVLCLTGMGVAAGAGPTRPTLQNETQPADAKYEIVRMSKPDGTVVEMRVPRHRSLLAKRPAGPRGTVRQLPGTAAAGEEPSETPQIGGRRAVRLQQAPTARASSEGPARPDSGRVVTQRANPQRADTGARISHPYTGSRQLTSGAVDVMRPTAVPRGGAVSQTPVVASDNASEWRTGLGWAPNKEDDETGRYLSDDDAFAELVPGDGWDGPTDDPGPIGNDSMPGWDAKAIARWDVVPYQTFDEPFHIGVVAFHMNGIDRVEFSVDGGPWVSVEEMQLNPRTDVWEYTAVLKPEYFEEDGLVEVRAVVWPDGAGVPRVLDSLTLASNPNSTRTRQPVWVSTNGNDETGTGEKGNPFATIRQAAWHLHEQNDDLRASAGTIYLTAGDHAFAGEAPGTSDPETELGWLTITAAPGLDADDVRLVESDSDTRLNATLTHLKNLTVICTLSCSPNITAYLWYDNCIMHATDRFDNTSFGGSTRWKGGIYATDCHIHSVMNGLPGTLLQRNVRVSNILSDAFQSAYMLVNCSVHDIYKPDEHEAHPDVAQWTTNDELDNVIIYGLDATQCKAQGLFLAGSGTASNIAYVNVLMELHPDSYTSQISIPVHHLYVSAMTHINRPFNFRSGAAGSSLVNITNSVFERIGANGDVFTELFNLHNNHLIDDTGLVGEDATTGDPVWDEDFYPRIASPLLNRILAPALPADVRGTGLSTPAAIGALQRAPVQ